MTMYNFSANGVDFGNYAGSTLAAAKEAFATDAGYKSWSAMVEQAMDVSGSNDVEVREIHNDGPK
jgi:hypothetical protein